MTGKCLAGNALALGNLVFVMRKNQIDAPRMQVKRLSEILHAHGTAFDMPSWSAFSPWRFPKIISVFRSSCFPKCKIGSRTTVVFIRNLTDIIRCGNFSVCQSRESSIFGKSIHFEINGAIICSISFPYLDQFLN